MPEVVLMALRFRIHFHAAELVECETFPVPADSFLAEQGRSAGCEFDPKCDCGHQWQRQWQADQDAEDVQTALPERNRAGADKVTFGKIPVCRLGILKIDNRCANTVRSA
jgi:hypothetical protein